VVGAGSRLSASATADGNGGTVVVWSQERTQAGDSISARGAGSGNGGRVEVSSHGELAFGASVDVGAPQGQAGTLLLDPTNIVIGDTAGTVSGNFALIDPSPAAGNDFGSGGVLELADRKFVVNSPNYDWGALLTDAGAVRLYSESGAMLSVLAGSRAGERVGSGGVYAVGTGLQNFVVSSPMWSNGAATNAGAVTWFQKGTEALQTISTANSLVGTHANDQVGQAVTVLSDGNYAVASPNWGNGNDLAVGAVTFRFGDLTARGIVSGDNSLFGTRAYDAIGKGGVTALRNGAYVVVSPDWAYNTTAKGAFTWVMPTTDIDGTPVGAIGTVSADNSLVSDKANGPSGFTAPSVTVLPDGNYVMTHSGFNNARGAVTWGSANAGVTGLMSLRANVVGNADGDQAGSGGVTGLANGNFVILSPMFNGEKGAATWASGEPVTQTHQQAQVGPYALTGNVKGDFADSSIVALSNGNYAVVLPMWDHMYYDPLLQPTPIVDRIDSGMAVVYKGVDGKNAVQTGRYDYTVSDHYDEFGIMGQSSYDRIGSGGIIPMVLPTDVTKATFAILSPHFDSDKGAISMVSAYNSRFMLGSTSNFTLTSAVSVVGANTGDMVGSGGGVALANGNALVASPNWSNTAAGTAYPNGSREGALTEVVGVYGQTNAGKIKSAGAIVGASNSLTGATAGDQIGSGGIFQLPDGQYLLNSPLWADADGSRVGAVSKLGDGTSLSGLLSPAESVTIAGSMEAGRTRGSVLTSARSLADQADDDKFLLQTINSADFGRQITIIDLTPVVGSSDPYSLLYSNATGTATLSRTNIANWLKGGTAVLLQASNDITVNGAIDTTGASGTLGKLTLQAGRSINLNADITTGGDVDFTANDTAAHGVIATLRSTGTDAASRLGGITMASGTTLTARNVALRVLDGVASDTAGAITLANVQAVSLKLYHAGLSPAGVTFSVGTKVYDQTTAAPTGQEQFDLTTKLAGVLSILGGSNLGTPVVRGYEFASADATSTPTFLANQALALTGFSNPFGLFNASGKALFLNGTGQITPRPVDLAGTKAYDATAVFNPATAGQLTASGLLAGDTVTLGGTLSVNNTRVNTYGYADLVNAGTLTLGTPNYALLAGSTVTLDITPRPISLAGSKTYDGSARFDASLLTVGSVLAGDVVRVSGSLVTDSANRGTYGATDVDATGLAISNANYRFTSASSATLTIKPRTLTFSGFKGFDGGPVFAAGNLVASNLLPGDTSGLSGSVTLASATPGLYGPEAVQAMTLTATNPNYQVGSTSAVSLVIAPPNPGEQAALAPGGGLVSTAATSLPLAVRGGGISLPAGVTAP